MLQLVAQNRFYIPLGLIDYENMNSITQPRIWKDNRSNGLLNIQHLTDDRNSTTAASQRRDNCYKYFNEDGLLHGRGE